MTEFRRHSKWMLRCFCIFLLLAGMALAEDSRPTPPPDAVAAHLALRGAKARIAGKTLRAFRLYSAASDLDPMNPEYRQNRDELEPLAKLLVSQNLEKADISQDVEASTLEATPGTNANVAFRIANKAEAARKAGKTVRAYLLFEAAATRDPANPTYKETAGGLASAARMMQQAHREDISADVKAAEMESLNGPDGAVKTVGDDWRSDSGLASLPHIQASAAHHDFDLHGDKAALIRDVTKAYGIDVILDPELSRTGSFAFKMTDTDFRGAMEGLAVATDTFVFPVSSRVLFFAEDTEAKRNELEPNIVLTVPLPESLTDKDLVETATAVRTVLNLKNFGWDSANHIVVIRDRFTRAHLAQSLLQSLLIPRAQVSLEVQFVTLDSNVSYEWGITPQTSFQLLSPIQKLFNLKTILPTLAASMYIPVGGGLSTFGIGVTSAQVLATYSKSTINNNYDATIVVEDGQAASLHVGEQYPIPTAIYTGASQTASSIYNPIGTFTQEDLGLILKVTPHVHSDGEVAMDIEADYKALGTQTFNTVPSVSERKFTGNVTLRQDEWAVLAGLDQSSKTSSRQGFPGLSEIPGLNQLISDNVHDTTASNTLVVLKPVVRRLPMSDMIAPQFLVGPVRGVRVLL